MGVEIPQESVEAVARMLPHPGWPDLWDELGSPGLQGKNARFIADDYRATARNLLQAAAPSLRTTYRAELEEELLGEEAVEAAALALFKGFTGDWSGLSEAQIKKWRNQARKALQAAALSVAGEVEQ